MLVVVARANKKARMRALLAKGEGRDFRASIVAT
jgi:hypothetical protein